MLQGTIVEKIAQYYKGKRIRVKYKLTIMKKIIITQTSITDAIEPQIGETIEKKIERIKNNGEGVGEGADLHYQERGEGIPFNTDIRNDVWEQRIAEREKITETYLTKREAAANEQSETDGNTGGTQET